MRSCCAQSAFVECWESDVADGTSAACRSIEPRRARTCACAVASIRRNRYGVTGAVHGNRALCARGVIDVADGTCVTCRSTVICQAGTGAYGFASIGNRG